MSIFADVSAGGPRCSYTTLARENENPGHDVGAIRNIHSFGSASYLPLEYRGLECSSFMLRFGVVFFFFLEFVSGHKVGLKVAELHMRGSLHILLLTVNYITLHNILWYYGDLASFLCFSALSVIQVTGKA